MKHTDRQWEERYLEETLGVVEKNVENYRRETERMQAEIDVMLEHYHDNDVELWTILNNTITLNEHMKRALSRNEKARSKPYFGRIIFRDETLDREESLYIGKGGISEDSTHLTVIDWRAPVAGVYYQNGLGKCSYQAPDGRPLPIDLKLKRTFEIEGGKLLSYFDTEVVANDDLLMKYLSKNKQAVLNEIVATIQKEQNEIIRKSPLHNVIVQGVAGSGKTTVAMHRISYILYNYQERFRPEDFYIVGSNRILLNYITGVLPDLDVHGVRQMTMEQLFVRLLYEDWDEKKYHIRPTGDGREALKGTEEWFQDLTAFIRRLEQETISQESVWLDPRQFVEGLEDGRNGVYDRRERDGDGKVRHSAARVELVSGEAVARYVSQNPGISIQSKINMLNERLLIKVKDEFLGKGIKYSDAERREILKAYRGRYGAKVWKKPIYELYRDFLQAQRERGLEVQIPEDGFDVYDLAALALLYKLVKETEVISEAHHIVIDEAQDFGMFVYQVLHTCIKACTYTVMGDVSQNIHFGFGLRDWEALKGLLLPDPQDSFGVLKKSYRNTVEISEFATRILRHGNFSVYPVEPIIRHGNPVTLEQINQDSGSLAERGAQILRDWQRQGCDTIAVVCRNEKAAKRAALELSRYIEILESDLEKADFGSGILVLPVEYTKGLEFDAVLLWNPTEKDYPSDDGHARLLYVAATRALHELCVLYEEELTGLIAESPKETLAPRETLTPKENLTPQETLPLKDALPSRRDPSLEKSLPPEAQPLSVRPTLTQTLPIQSEPAQSSSTDRPSRPAVTAKKAAVTKQAVISDSHPERTSLQAKMTEKPGAAALETPCRGISGAISFGDIPATEKLRPTGHSKINQSFKWYTKKEDGLYFQGQYGVLRICPVAGGIVRVTFVKGNGAVWDRHPLISVDRVEKSWTYRDSGKITEISTGELVLQIDRVFGDIRYLTPEKKLLFAERKQECRLVEKNRSWLFLDWQKGEQVFALGPEDRPALSLRGTARYLSWRDRDGKRALPFLFSDRGYGILPASAGEVFSCDLPGYGTYLHLPQNRAMGELEGRLDYYVIVGRQQKNLWNAYAYLRGML